MGTLTLKKAEYCLWLGRYTERVYTELREFFAAYDVSLDTDRLDFARFCRACDIEDNSDKKLPGEFLYDLLYDRNSPASVCYAAHAAVGNVMLLRPELSTQTMSYVELALSDLRKSKDQQLRLLRHRSVCDDLLAFWGALENGEASPSVKALVFLGKYLERVDLFARFEKDREEFASPLLKVGFYLACVPDNEHLPVDEWISQVAADVEQHGYADEARCMTTLTARVRNPTEGVDSTTELSLAAGAISCVGAGTAPITADVISAMRVDVA